MIEENKLYASNDAESLKKLEKLKAELLDLIDENGFVDLSNEAAEPAEIATTEQGLGAGSAQDITGISQQVQAAVEPNDQLANPDQLSMANTLEANDAQSME